MKKAAALAGTERRRQGERPRKNALHPPDWYMVLMQSSYPLYIRTVKVVGGTKMMRGEGRGERGEGRGERGEGRGERGEGRRDTVQVQFASLF